MTELKPCPFCGGTYLAMDKTVEGFRRVCCLVCVTDGPLERTEAEAIEAWNKRAKRTCHMTYNEEWSGDEYYPTQAYTCSKCGWITEMGVPRYCPSCGAKVVEE